MVVVLLYNPIGLMMCFLTAFVTFIPGVYLPRPSQDNWILVGAWGAIVFVWDFLYRVFNRDEHWLSPRRGGHIFFIPVCVLGYGALYWYASQAAKLGYWFPHTTPDPFWNRSMPTVPELLASGLPPLDIVEPIGHAIIDKSDAEAHGLAQLSEPEAVVMVLWGFYGSAMNHPYDGVLSQISANALYLALHRVQLPKVAAAMARADDPRFFEIHQAQILTALLNYIRAHSDTILPGTAILGR